MSEILPLNPIMHFEELDNVKTSIDKETYFKSAILAGLYKKKAWMIAAFSITADSTAEDASKQKINIVRQGGLPYYVSSDNRLIRIDGGVKAPLYAFRDRYDADSSICPNLSSKLSTTRGQLLFNLISLVGPFGIKIDYQNGKIDINKISKIIADRLHDTPEEGVERDPNLLYVDEYKQFVNSLFYLTNFTQLAVWALTEKLITPPPDIDKVRAELLKKYGNDLSYPVVLSNFEQELLKLDSEYLKDDPGGQFFQSGGKSRNIVRKRLFLTYGAEPGLVEEGRTRRPVVQSLRDGWVAKDMPALIDALRAGSYNRGKRTALGGELTKWLFRASTGIEMTDEDCHTRMGQIVKITDQNYKHYAGKYYISTKGVQLIPNVEMAKSLVGQTLTIRSPLFCHASANNYCPICLGTGIAKNKDGISLAIAEIGSMFLLMKMKQMHGKALTTAQIDINATLS